MATKLTKEDTHVKGLKADIVELAQQIGVGQFGAELCPDCRGGSSKERSLSIEVGQNGIIKFYCHRASCGFSGNAYLSPTASHLGIKQASESRERGQNPLTEPVSPLSEREVAFFLSRYGIPEASLESRVYRTESRYALPLLRRDGTRRGFITRRPYPGSPADTAANRNDPQAANKTLTYLEADEPCLSWYGASRPECLVLVEDQLSAMRLTSFWESLEGEAYPVTAAAILGTGVNAEKIREIQQVAQSCDVWIALDADATGQAFAMCRKWGSAFKRCNVCVLSKDIKDSSDEELSSLPI
jgi:hypothetical protein